MSRRDVLLKALAATPNDLRRTVASLPVTVADQRPSTAEWSVADVLGHLIIVERLSLKRLQRVAETERPIIESIHPNEAAHDLTQPVAALLADFEQARAETLSFLHSLKAGQWQRTGVHSSRGKMSLRALVQFLSEHDTVHLNQIVTVRGKVE